MKRGKRKDNREMGRDERERAGRERHRRSLSSWLPLLRLLGAAPRQSGSVSLQVTVGMGFEYLQGMWRSLES